MNALQSSVARNDYGLPIGFYRLDLLPPINAVTVDPNSLINLEKDSLSAAFTPLNYQDGYPVLVSGELFWQHLNFEPLALFRIFDQYLHAGSKRSLSKVKAEVATREALHLAYYAYVWSDRAQAYDMYMVAQFRRQQEFWAMASQTKHYQLADKLFNKLEAKFGEEDFFEQLEPKLLLEMLKVVASLQRISSGLPQSGPAASPPSGSNIELVMRSIYKENVNDIKEDSDGVKLISRVLASPETTRAAQELLIKVGP